MVFKNINHFFAKNGDLVIGTWKSALKSPVSRVDFRWRSTSASVAPVQHSNAAGSMGWASVLKM
jgi:hypothetical protein